MMKVYASGGSSNRSQGNQQRGGRVRRAIAGAVSRARNLFRRGR